MEQLEKMGDFFAKRAGDYDRHMLQEVQGADAAYRKVAELMPDKMQTLLDLGCGTGLELLEMFQKNSALQVTGIDMCQGMLDKLKEKYPEQDITLILGSYVGRDFGTNQYDAAVSMETLHHLSHEEKTALYRSLHRALRDGGQYIECDYMVTEQAEEDALYAENARLRKEQDIPDGEFYHFDTPCTIENQKTMLRKAGFSKVEFIWREGATTILKAYK
ncbi:MAG: class I SAM-dependent methyltransferase [Oscillospiraceae bacterium]|jgi:ubiquinone/menaquinone biosynthesis C-methylase UbiE|nr:class I SAM-dependent methyltransferase [Oscillospiraceae bacterium]